MKYFFLSLILFLSINLSAQQYWQGSRYALVYELTDEQAEILAFNHFEKGERTHLFENLTTPFDTITFDKIPYSLDAEITKRNYPVGHYVLVRASGEFLEYQFYGNYDIGIVPVTDEKEFHFHILDSLGNILKADEVRLEDKSVNFNEEKRRYEHRKFKETRFLMVEFDGKKAFFEVNPNHYNNRSYDYGRRTGNWFKRKWYRIVNSNLWYDPLYFLQNFWNRQVNDFNSVWGIKTYGYITTNKPQYLPNDTVKIKAYLTRDNKIAYNRPLTLKINQYGNYNFETTIKPTSRGNYEFEFPLGDSLRLDKTYSITIYNGRKSLMSTSFVYEDYQLDEVEYKLRADQKEFKRDEPIVFYAEGKNKNGQYVMDGEVEITAKISNIKAYHAQKVYIPDTLFHYKGALDLGEAMRFPLPKETIPMADFTVNISGVFTNSNGEIQQKNLNFDVISDSTFIEMSLDGDTLLVEYFENGQSVSTLATLDFDLQASDFYVEKTVQLPYKTAINPIFNEITATAKNDRKSIQLYSTNYWVESLVKEPTFNLVQTKDSIFVFGNNPNGLAVNYEIYRVNRKIASGESKAKSIIWKDKISKRTSYRIDYEYVMKGENQQNSQRFNHARNQLSIEIEQPTQIQPGETVDVKVKVRKSNNNKARNVNLVAGAVNTQFNNTQVWKYNVPFYGRMSDDKSTNNYYNKNSKYSVKKYDKFNWRMMINNRFREHLNLDDELYYRLLFADSLYTESVNIPNDTLFAQFAPFVVKDGQFQKVYLAYANRQFVYYHDTETPYSFKGREGYNQVTLRGLDFEIVMDSVYMKAGEKLFLAINLDKLPKNTRKYTRPKELTGAEQNLIRTSIFTYRHTGNPTQIYLWHRNIVYEYNIGKREVNFGPFDQYPTLTMIKKNDFKTSFYFEPGFIYEIEKNRERLYHNPDFPNKKLQQIGTINRGFNLNDKLLLDRNIAVKDSVKKYVEPLILRQVRAAFNNVRYTTNGGKIKYLINRQDSLIYTYILIHEPTNATKFFNNNVQFRQLQTGNYKMYGFTKWGNYFTHDVTIRKDTMLYEYLEQPIYQKDKDLRLLKSLVALKDIVIPQQSIGQTQPKPKDKKKKETITYSGLTYPISGKVTDESGESLIGCSIIIKGTEIGTITDFDGSYTIEVPESIQNPILVIHYIGFTSQEVEAGNFTSIDVTMDESDVVLEEVVVVGYGIAPGSGRAEEKIQTMSIEADAVESIKVRGIASLRGQAAGVSAENRIADTDYYLDGVLITDTTMLNNLQASSKIRSRFSDYAFFEPNLSTDRKGEAIFRVTYPDDITSYQTFVVGMDRKHNFGVATKTVQSQKMALAQLAIPRFMVIGDKANIIGKSLNYSNDSLRIKSTFLLDDKVLKTSDFWLENAKIETAELSADTDKDTLMLTYKMEHSKFFDGEKRPIPIYRKGVEETVGSFNILHGDTSLTLEFEQDKGNVKMYARTDVLEVLLEDVQYLIDYPYGCNEQTASRLLALLMDKQIKTALGQKPPKDELIIKMVKRLEKAQNPNGSWGWWQGNEANYWMTNYVLKALYAADTSGYKTPSYETGLRFITNSLETISPYEILNSIELLSDVGQNMDYEKYLAVVDSTLYASGRHHGYYNQLRIIKIKQQQDLAYDLSVLDTLENQTLFGGIFYDVSKSQYPSYRWYWYSNHYNLTQLAYQVLRNENVKQNGEYDYKLASIRGYFLEKRTRYGWRNTFTTAQILSTILPDMMNGQPIEKPKLVIKSGSTQTVTTFPFETTFYTDQPIEIEKSGTSMIYLTAFQQFWNDKPTPKSDIFELKSQLVQNGKVVKKLEAKTPAKMVVTVEVKKEAEYVMVEIPIPAGCSYGEKSRGYGYWYGREVHREYFREKTCVFYQNLPVGTYTIEINLEPRFTGEYTVNPAKAEEMYFPVFYGRNAMKEVEIEE